MQELYYPIAFSFNGTAYEGRVTPEIKAHQHAPSSYHVVLNDVFFGYMHRNNHRWHVTEQRPDELVAEVGKAIDKMPEDTSAKN